jgi:hypothetical protein
MRVATRGLGRVELFIGALYQLAGILAGSHFRDAEGASGIAGRATHSPTISARSLWSD